MKVIVSVLTLVIALICFATEKTSAQTNDTLYVYADSGLSLDETIMSDTTSYGVLAHKVYKLVSLNLTYVFLSDITVNSDIEVIGQLGSDGRPPCIQPGLDPDGEVPTQLFVLNGRGITGKFKDLYLLGTSTINTTDCADAISVTEDSVKVIVDNVVFDAWWGNSVYYLGNWDKFYITNSVFRNFTSPWSYCGEAFRNGNGTGYTDTISFKNNTFFCGYCYAACPVTAALVNYFDFSNNNVMWFFNAPFWIFNVTNAKINNNIFYGVWAGCQNNTEYYGKWDQLLSLEVGSTIDLDSLTKRTAADFGIDTSLSNWRTLAEQKRNIEVKNNAYYTPSKLSDFYKTWNDTASEDYYLNINPFMNDRTTGMFTDKTMWPGLTESGNMNVDPGFGSSILSVLDNNVGNGIGLLEYFTELRTNNPDPGYYGYQLQDVVGDTWVPTWPLPEKTDMQYSNSALKTGSTTGSVIGDPNWFGIDTDVKETSSKIPATFSLSNAYPNPFNPSTNIQFTVAKSENVKLVVYNTLGQKVKTLVNQSFQPGSYTISWNGTDEHGASMASGIYFYRFESQSFTSAKKMILMK